MSTINMLEAKSNLSELVRAVEAGEQEEIIIARNGVPAARLVPLKKNHGSGSASRKASMSSPMTLTRTMI